MKNDFLAIGPLQIKILKSLWKLGSGSVHDILADWQAAGEKNLPAYVTVLTVLRRLEARGLLSHTCVGRSFVYRPETDEFGFKQALMTRVADTLFDGLIDMRDWLCEHTFTLPRTGQSFLGALQLSHQFAGTVAPTPGADNGRDYEVSIGTIIAEGTVFEYEAANGA